MSNLGWLLLFLIILPFGLVLFSGAPYLPTKKRQLRDFLTLIKVKPGQKLIDLGSGDGGVIKMASSDFKMTTVGYELNPFLVLLSRVRLWRLGSQASVNYGDFWRADIDDDIDYVYVFLLPRLMKKLKKHLEASLAKPVILISYSFKIPGEEPFAAKDGFIAYRVLPKESSSDKI